MYKSTWSQDHSPNPLAHHSVLEEDSLRSSTFAKATLIISFPCQIKGGNHKPCYTVEFPFSPHFSYWHRYICYPAPTVSAECVSDLGFTKYPETKSSSKENWQNSTEVNRTLIFTILE